MSGGDDWQVGDLAMCTLSDSYEWYDANDRVQSGPCKGEVLRVVGIGIEPTLGTPALHFDEHPSPEGWDASFFRKIKPDAEPCEEEFTLLIKRMKPAKAPEVAV